MFTLFYMFYMFIWKPKKLCDFLYCRICFVEVIWNHTSNISKVCLYNIVDIFLAFSITERGMLKSSTRICIFVYFCQFLMYTLLAMLLGAYKFRVIISSWWIICLIILKNFSKVLVILFALKSTLSEVNIVNFILTYLCLVTFSIFL